VGNTTVKAIGFKASFGNSAVRSAAYTISSAGPSVKLSWNASTGTDVSGYQIRYGQVSGSYPQTVDVGNTTSTIIANLNNGTTYYFVVVAYNSATVTSPPSNEVSYTTPVALTHSDGRCDTHAFPFVNTNSTRDTKAVAYSLPHSNSSVLAERRCDGSAPRQGCSL
jgi:hypothetical protein